MAMAWSIPFIGREEELKTIHEHIKNWGTRRIVFICGEGGIGKTRLLHEIETQFSVIDKIKILPIIDFDDDQYKFPQNVGITVGCQLNPKEFKPYLEALRRMSALKEGQSALIRRRQTLTLNHCFIECFNEVSNRKRIVLRIDTIDILHDAVLLEYLYELVSQFSNVVILIAGRDVKTWHDKYQRELADDVTIMPLQPFTLVDSRAYLEKKQHILKVTLEKKWMDKLFILARGLPVLIDLAIEWAQKHRPLEWIDQHSLSDLQDLEQRQAADSKARQKLYDLREEFTRIVVMPTADLDSRFDYLKLVLSKVYPLDLEGIMEMLNLSQDQAKRLFSEAQQSVAIKNLPDGRIKLHDEVQRLVNLHAWPNIDQSKQWEIRDSRRALMYLKRKSEALLEDIRQLRAHELEQLDAFEPEHVLDIFSKRHEKESKFWSLRLDLLRRQLAIDVQQGYELFQHDYQLSREEAPSLSYRQGLLTAISPYTDFKTPHSDIYGNTLAEKQQLFLQSELAKQATYNGMYNKAAETYRQLLKRFPKDDEMYLSILNGQANLLVRAGELQEALRVNEQALQLSKELNSHNWQVQSLLAIGWVHRLMGHLGQAQQYYNDAIKLAFEYDDEKRIALIYNNLAYVHAFQHQGKALDEIKQAIKIWKRLVQEKEENNFHLGQCYNIAGEIYLEMEHPEESLPYFELSWNIFNQEELETQGEQARAEWRSKSRSGQGFAYWQLAVSALNNGDQEVAERYLQDALRDLEWAVERATEVDSPVIRNRLGEVHFLLKNYEATEKTWIESMDEARQVGDAFTEFHSLAALTRLAFFHPVAKFPGWKDFEHWYKHDYRQRYQVYFEGLDGLFYTYLGHLAFKEENTEQAVRLYERGFPVLTENISYTPFNLIDQLDFVEQEILPHISVECVQQVGKTLKEHWMVETYDIVALTYFREWACWMAS